MSGIAAQALRRMIALAMALLLVPMGQAELFAQQAPPPQSWSQSDAPRGRLRAQPIRRRATLLPTF